MDFFGHPDIRRKATRPEFKRRAEEIVARLKSDVRPFEDSGSAAVEARRNRARTDVFSFGSLYLPHYFSAPPASFHAEADRLINAPIPAGTIRPPILIAAPREHAKTTAISFLQTIHKAVFGSIHFAVLGSDTNDLASDLTAYLFLELCGNERLQADFGLLCDHRQSVRDFVIATDVRIYARGAGQRLRGIKHGPHRPDFIALDDLENDKNVNNPRLVKERLAWVTGAVLPSLDTGGTLVWVGTILARRSALGTAIHSEAEPYVNWTRRLYRAIQPDGSALWPERWPVDLLQARRRQIGSVAFNREYQNNPTDEESPFREEWFKTFRPADLAGRKLLVASATDPSSTTQGDDKGHAVVGLDRADMKLYVLEAWGKKLSPSGLMDALYDSHKRHGWAAGAIEENALKEFLGLAINEAAKRHGRHLPLRPIHNAANKEARIIGTLSPLVEFGRLLFPEADPEAERLQEELLYLLDGSTPDNRADALEMAVRLVQALPAGATEYATVDRRAFRAGDEADDDDDSGAALGRRIEAGVGLW